MNSHKLNTHSRSGFTLIEVATSLAIMTVLMLGLSGALMISTHAIPTATDTGLADQGAIDVLNQMRSDLREADAIEYRLNASDTKIHIWLVSNTAPGHPDEVVYRYDHPSDTIIRTPKGGASSLLIENVTALAVAVTENGGDASSLQLIMYVDKSIQRFFEMNVSMPYKPVSK